MQCESPAQSSGPRGHSALWLCKSPLLLLSGVSDSSSLSFRSPFCNPALSPSPKSRSRLQGVTAHSYSPQRALLKPLFLALTSKYTHGHAAIPEPPSLTDISLRSAAAHSVYLSDPYSGRSRLKRCDWLSRFRFLDTDWLLTISSPCMRVSAKEA